MPTLDKRGANVDWIDVAGYDWYDEFTVEELDADGNVVGPVDLTDCAITANVGELDFTVDVIDAVTGRFSLAVARAVTADAELGRYPWRCSVADPDERLVRWLYGTFTVVAAEVDL